MKMLIIEDDVAFSNALARRLSKFGFESKITNEAANILNDCQSWQPSYVLLDMNLAGESGLNYIEQIRAKLPLSKIVLLTGFASIATAVDAVKKGADDYLTKPADTSLIVKTLLGQNTDAISCSQTMSAERVEWEHIQQVLKLNNGNVSETARQLNMHRRTLQRKLQKRPAQK